MVVKRGSRARRHWPLPKLLVARTRSLKLVIEQLGNWLANKLIRYIPGISTVENENRRSLGIWCTIGVISALTIFVVSIFVNIFTATQESLLDWILFGFQIGIGSSLTVNESADRFGTILMQFAGFFFGLFVVEFILTLKGIYGKQDDTPRTQDIIISDRKREAVKENLKRTYECDQLRQGLRDWANREEIRTRSELKANLKVLTRYLRTLVETEIIEQRSIAVFRISKPDVVDEQITRLYNENRSTNPGSDWNRAQYSILCDLGIIILEEEVVGEESSDS